MSVLAVLAGVVVARLEYDAETAGRPADSATGQPAAGAARPHGPEPSIPPGSGSEGQAHDGEAPPDDASVAQPVSVPPDELRRRREQIEDLVAAQRFGEAAESAGELLGALEEQGMPHDDEDFTALRRLEAKSRVFGLLVEGIDRSRTPPAAKRVSLANGSTLEVVRADREGDGYVLELPGGITYRPRLDEVVEVREMSPDEQREFAAGEWERLKRRLEKLDDPIELYVRGVERCYRLGLEDQGLELLERLLAMPGSGKIPLRFAGADAAGAARGWEIAAGRTPEERAARAARTADDQRPRPPRVPDSPDAVLTRARALRDEARTLYRRGFPREGDKGDRGALAEARRRLEEAFTLIETLPPSDEADELRSELGQILSDVVRVSPF